MGILIKELDGVDFAILMAFASLNYEKRNTKEIQDEYKKKLRTYNSKIIIQELYNDYDTGGDSAFFIRNIAGVPKHFR